MNVELKRLSSTECYKISKEMFKNSDQRWDSAIILLGKQDYGGAINSHITSIEEMIKGIIMLLDSKGFEFRKADNVEIIIRKSHSIRHLISYFMFLMGIAGDELKAVLLKLKADPTIIERYSPGEKDFETIMNRYALRKMVIIKREFEWFSKVESLRQEGLYVDYNYGMKSPSQINAKDYDEIHNRLLKVRDVGFGFLEMLESNDETLLKPMNDIKQKFLINDMYTKIGNAIAMIKGKDPFKVMRKNMK